MKAFLKIKVVSLAAEAKLIRRDERRFIERAARAKADVRRRTLEWTFVGLRTHRVTVVRAEARAACLAYAFLRGRAYRQVERTTHSLPDWGKVAKLIERYGGFPRADLMARFEVWKDEALTRFAAAA